MPNRLGSETSPYLLQHKDNPVDWYPWGPEAMAAAALEEPDHDRHSRTLADGRSHCGRNVVINRVKRGASVRRRQ